MTRVRGLAGLAVVSTVLLTGCGAVPDFAPGVAARVGDENVSVQTVADTAVKYCKAVKPQLQGQMLANHYLNADVAGGLALRSAAEQVLAERDLEVDASYDKAVEQAKQQFSTMSDSELDAFIEVAGAQVFATAAAVSIGHDELGASASSSDAAAAGLKVLDTWMDDNDVAIDPRYGVSIKDAQLVIEDTSVSYGLSDTVSKADAKQADPVYAASLPSTQRCG